MARGKICGIYSKTRSRGCDRSCDESYSRGYNISKDRAQGGARDRAIISDNIAIDNNSNTKFSNLDIVGEYECGYSKYTIQPLKKI